jgi:signal transduction histidine kinase
MPGRRGRCTVWRIVIDDGDQAVDRRDVAVGVGVAAAVAVGSAIDRDGVTMGVGGALLLVALAVLVALRDQRPRLVLGGVFVVVLVFLGLVGPTYVVLVPLAVVLYSVGARGSRTENLVIAALMVPAALVIGAFSPEDGPWLAQVLEVLGWLNLALVLGEAVRSHRALLAAMSERADRAELDREQEARRRVAEERLRIARELHDVVAHSIATIDTQASVGLHLAQSDPSRAVDALRAVKAVSGGALHDLRAALGTLRERGEDAPVAPTPGVGELPALVERARSGGNRIDLRIDGSLTEIPAPIGLAAYRIVQEALTNVMRHAAGASAQVRVFRTPDVLCVEVDDDGRGTAGAHTPLGSGSGVAGMRERALAIGGDLQAGPRAGGGFGVRARLPLVSAA